MINIIKGFFKKNNSPSIQKISRNFGWLLFDAVIRFGGGLFITAGVARYLGPEEFGILSYAIAFVSIFSFLGAVGLNDIIFQDIVRNPAKRAQILATGFLLKVFGGVLAFGLAICLSAILDLKEAAAFWVICVIASGMFFQAFDVIDFYFQSQLQAKYAVLARAAAFILISAVKIYLILSKAPLISFAWAILGEGALGGILLLNVYQSRGLSFCLWDSSRIMAKRLVKSSWPILLSGIAAMIYFRIDQLILRYFMGDREVGIYAAAVRICEIWGILGALFMSSVFPVILSFKQADERLYWAKIRQVYRFLIFLGIGASALMITIAGPAVSLLYGAPYQNAAGVLSVYILGVVFLFLGGASTYVLVSEGLQRYQVYRTVIACLVNIILNLIFIPRFGALGAAVAAVFSLSIPVIALGWFRETRMIIRIGGV